MPKTEITIDGIVYKIDKKHQTACVSDTIEGELPKVVAIVSYVSEGKQQYPVTGIGDSAFGNCDSLTSITIPDSITSIGYDAFRGCSGLISIVVEGENSVYDSRNDCNAIIETATNMLIAGCRNTIIPDSVTSIERYAFSDCENLSVIRVPKGKKETYCEMGLEPWRKMIQEEE